MPGESQGRRGGAAVEDPEDDLASPLPLDRVEEMIGDADPPPAVRRVLRSRAARLVFYEEIRREGLAMGPPVGSVGLDGRIAGLLEEKFGTLYAYQAEAIRRILGGESVVIEAPTAAGKTVAFLAPVVHRVSRSGRRGIKAIFVYPTKALARDQGRKIAEMACVVKARTMVFDRDTGKDERDAMLGSPPDILITNFDTLHHQMYLHRHLAGHLRHVETLVVDEAHTYTGAFGSNVHHVVARLRRFSGGIQCVAASATLSGSEEFCSGLFGQEVRAVSGRGRLSTLDFAIMAPLTGGPGRDRRIRRHELAVRAAEMMQEEGGKTILFSNSHRGAEMVGALGARAGLRMEVHRAGLRSPHLRGVEGRLRSGETRVVSCTPTLELGMDIGGVDTVVSEVVPANRFLQRIGRAGRGGGRGHAFLVLGHDPISQYYRRHPGDYLEDAWRPRINPKNPRIEEIHTVAMAIDAPLGSEEATGRGRVVRRCVSKGLLKRIGRAVLHTDAGEQAVWDHNIRGITDPVAVAAGGERIGERARPAALSELHPGAVYMSGGRPHRVASLDERAGVAAAEPMDEGDSRYTIATAEKRIDDASVVRSSGCNETGLQYCDLAVTVTVAKYAEKDYVDHAHIAFFDLAAPVSYTFETCGIRLWPRTLAGGGAQESALHAMEHAIIEAACMVVGASRSDLGSASQGDWVYVYDNGGENGTSAAMYGRMGEIVSRAHAILAGCGRSEDERGCVHCTFSHSCGRGNDGLHKDGAKELLQRMADARTESGHNPGLGAQLAISGREGCVQ
ncbi:MAG: DEAD/DEAH box helicase [Thaumarchaeota archaeon]|nr:DEAD/DEAH box helicase [Nitrososphaerota archaeon]